MEAEKNWNEVKIGEAVMLTDGDDIKGGNTRLLVIDIIRDKNEDVTHLICAWDTKTGLKDKKLPVQVLRPYKDARDRVREYFEKKGFV